MVFWKMKLIGSKSKFPIISNISMDKQKAPDIGNLIVCFLFSVMEQCCEADLL